MAFFRGKQKNSQKSNCKIFPPFLLFSATMPVCFSYSKETFLQWNKCKNPVGTLGETKICKIFETWTLKKKILVYRCTLTNCQNTCMQSFLMRLLIRCFSPGVQVSINLTNFVFQKRWTGLICKSRCQKLGLEYEK